MPATSIFTHREDDKIIPVLTMDTLDGRRTAIPASTA